MHTGGGKVPEALVGAFGIVEGSISADLILGRILISVVFMCASMSSFLLQKAEAYAPCEKITPYMECF
jgi:hypothetical protein